MAVVSTADATFVAPVSHSQHVKKIVEELEKNGRAGDALHPRSGPRAAARCLDAAREALVVEEALPVWSSLAIDTRHGGYY